METWAQKFTRVVEDAIDHFEPRSVSVQLGRSLIAVAQILTLTFTPWERLTPQIVNTPQSPVCRGASSAALFCLAPADRPGVGIAVAIAVLVLVCAGIVPRVVSFAHAWVSYSIAVSLGLPDGGEQVAQVVSILLVGVSIADGRWIAWRRAPRPAKSSLLGVAFAAWWVLRLQMAGVYLQSGIAKLGVEDWVNGSAMYYVVRDSSFGASGPVGELMEAVTATPVGVAVLTWGTILGEVALAVLLLSGPRARRVALGIAVALHVGIIASIGLWSFGLIMIGAVCAASNVDLVVRRRVRPAVRRRGRGDPAEFEIPTPAGGEGQLLAQSRHEAGS